MYVRVHSTMCVCVCTVVSHVRMCIGVYMSAQSSIMCVRALTNPVCMGVHQPPVFVHVRSSIMGGNGQN